MTVAVRLVECLGKDATEMNWQQKILWLSAAVATMKAATTKQYLGTNTLRRVIRFKMDDEDGIAPLTAGDRIQSKTFYETRFLCFQAMYALIILIL